VTSNLTQLQDLQRWTLNKNNELNVTSNLTQPNARFAMTNTKQEQQIKCDIELDSMQDLQQQTLN
jgi:hypothetical protein